MSKEEKTSTMGPRWIAVIVVVLVVFAGTYGLALASGRTPTPAPTPANASGAVTQASSQPAAASGAGCACGMMSGTAASGASTTPKTASTGSATLSGSVQKISVDLSSGAYDPSTISLKAGVPAEITFGKGSGCLSVVQSSDLGFRENLTSGPKTVKLPALQPGTYSFSCGMEMVFGKIVVS